MSGIILLCVVASAGIVQAQLTNPGASRGPSSIPFATTTPNLPRGKIAVQAPPGPFFRDFRPPFPTDSWWQPFGVGVQNKDVAGPFPFLSRTENTGFQFGVSNHRVFDDVSIKQEFQRDLEATIVGLPNTIGNRKLTSWDTQTVCLQYANGAQTMDTCLVPGSPYMTLTYNNALLQLTSLNGTVNFQWVNTATKAKISNIGGTYILYVVSGTLNQLTIQGTTITSNTPFTGTIRLAKIFEASQEVILDQYSGSYATGVTMSYKVTGDKARVTWKWNVIGDESNYLQLSWPHHRKLLQEPSFVDIKYITIKGWMKGVAGNTWVLDYDLPTITWKAPRDPHISCLAELNLNLEAEVDALKVLPPGNVYFWGGSMARDANLANIADHIGRKDLIPRIIDIVKQGFEARFNPNTVPGIAYETGWGGFVHTTDKSNIHFNDHHFVYGYWLQAASIIGKYDPAWLAKNIDFFTHIARDIGNPSPQDPHYTVSRHIDFFSGHSWASGIENSAGARNQESTSEAINGYYALHLFGTVTNNAPLVDYARLLLSFEILGAKTYWHLYPKIDDPDTPYPEQEVRDLTSIGNIYSTQAGSFSLWGGGSKLKTQVIGIQVVPLTPNGENFYDRPWMEQVLPYLMTELNDYTIGDSLKSVIYSAYASVNPKQAYTYSTQIIDWGTGNYASNMLYFISTRISNEAICSPLIPTPEGVFFIQDSKTGLYVTSQGGSGGLKANAGVDILATKFRLKFKPGGSTIQALSTGKYVTAAPDGGKILNGNKDVALTNELFRWKLNTDGTYGLKAMVKYRAVVSTNSLKELINGGSGTRYRLMPTLEGNPSPPIIPATGTLKNIGTGKFVISTNANRTLLATETSAATATTWSFEIASGSPPESPIYNIKSTTLNLFVTGDSKGTTPLTSSKGLPGIGDSSWETFRFYFYQGAYIIVHVQSGNAVSVQPGATLVANNSGADAAAKWMIA